MSNATYELDGYDEFFLLEIAESANPPDAPPTPEDDFCEVTFPARGGWQVVIFYDGGDLDYIDHFITPEGVKLEPWDRELGEQWPPINNWRGVGDLARLREGYRA